MLTIGILLSIFLFFVSDVIVPITSVKANRIWYGEVKKKYFVTSKEMNIWIKENRLIVHINYYHPKDRAIFGVTINNFDKNFRLIRRVDAKKGFLRMVNGICISSWSRTSIWKPGIMWLPSMRIGPKASSLSQKI